MDLTRFFITMFFIINTSKFEMRDHHAQMFILSNSAARVGGLKLVRSEAFGEDQMFAVLLHRIDKELLHGILLHSNTS